MYEDTIAAISTSLGEGGIGIVRLSGEEAHSIAGTFFRGKLADRRLSHGYVFDPETGEVVDEVLASYMAAPRTYTREDVVEINCHGGPIPLQRTLQLALRYGARFANPGEFTLRAFMNGRIDLVQAESVLDVIRARTEASLRLAMHGLDGRLSNAIKTLRDKLMFVLAYITARIDFPEDDIEPQDMTGDLDQCLQEVRTLIASAGAGTVFRQGVRTAIVGRPNVGKSSLLNRLLRQERSIVTPVPGTTRDTIEEVVNLQGVPFILVDTAGIAYSTDPVESLGVARSRRAIEQADLVLLVLDTSEPLREEDHVIMGFIGEKPALAAANKADLPLSADLDGILWKIHATSALGDQGIDGLEAALVKLALGGNVVTSDFPLISNPRHKEALERVGDCLAQALAGLSSGVPEDLISIDLTSALSALGEITGKTVGDELLETIFSSFCIGK